MIHYFFNEDRHIILVVYQGAITLEQIDNYEKFVHNCFASLKGAQKIINITDLSRGKIANGEFTERLANLTQQYKSQTEMIYVTGMSAFARILYKTYLRIVGNHEIHMIAGEPLDTICERFDIQTPQIYYELHNKNVVLHH